MPATAAAIRAGIAAFNDHPYIIDSVGEPMVVAKAPFLSEDILDTARLLALSLPAAQEALSLLLPVRDKIPPFPLIIGLPSHRPGLPHSVEKELADNLREALASQFPIASIESIGCGHAAGLMALECGWKKIRSGAVEFCLIGGVDSYMAPETLEFLEEWDQLHSAGAMNNAWGFIPGEAAGFCLMASYRATQKWNLHTLAQVLGVVTSNEKNLIKTDSVCLGRGLTKAFQMVFQYLPSPTSKVDEIICDMNGEPYRAEEFGFATIRTENRFVDSSNFNAPADCWGDVGAASGPLFINLSALGHRKGYLDGKNTLVWTSSESGERTAAILGF